MIISEIEMLILYVRIKYCFYMKVCRIYFKFESNVIFSSSNLLRFQRVLNLQAFPNIANFKMFQNNNMYLLKCFVQRLTLSHCTAYLQHINWYLATLVKGFRINKADFDLHTSVHLNVHTVMVLRGGG